MRWKTLVGLLAWMLFGLTNAASSAAYDNSLSDEFDDFELLLEWKMTKGGNKTRRWCDRRTRRD